MFSKNYQIIKNKSKSNQHSKIKIAQSPLKQKINMRKYSYLQQDLLCLQPMLGAVANLVRLCDIMIYVFRIIILIQLTIENMLLLPSNLPNNSQNIKQLQNPQKGRNNISKQMLASSRRQQESGIIYPNNQYKVCTKYNQCMEENIKENAIDRSFNGSDQTFFDIPLQILAEQQPRIIQILPSNPYMRDTHQTDLIVQNNIRQKIYLAKLQKKKQKDERQLIKYRLKQLQQVAKQKLKNAPKSELSLEKATKWGHSIFGEAHKQNKQQKQTQRQNDKDKIIFEKNKIQTKIIMKPINQRIQQYKKSSVKMQAKIKELKECNHKHIRSEKNIEQKNKQIQKNAKQALKKMREQKLQSQQRKKILKGKIRAIQIQSRQSLKKYKKKPVDSTIEFRVDIQAPTNQKKSKKGSNSQNSLTSQELLKAEAIKQNLKKLQNLQKNKNKKYLKSNTKSSEKRSSKAKQQSQKIDTEHKNEENQSQSAVQNKKFYFWDIPIYKQDYSKIQNDYYEQMLAKKKPKNKTFREEVDQYLNQKLHKEHQQSIRQSKQKRFEDLVEMKKQQFLSEFQSQQNQPRNMEEVFWNEDSLYKLHPISNF